MNDYLQMINYCPKKFPHKKQPLGCFVVQEGTMKLV